MVARQRKVMLHALFYVSAGIILIYDSKTCAEAASRGIELCLRSVIPALFPMMVLSRWAMQTELPRKVSRAVGWVMPYLFGQPRQAAICLILGLLGGYPMGAQAISMAYAQGLVNRQQSESLLAFCNNAGPAFFFGIVGASLGGFPVAIVLYCIHILSAILVGFLLKSKSVDAGRPTKIVHPTSTGKPEVLLPCIRSMALICGNVIVFQIIICIIEQYAAPYLPHVFRIALTGFLELTSGCLYLTRIDSIGWRYCLASGFLGFGGLCVWTQTRSIVAGSGLKGKNYLFGKLLHSVIAGLLTWIVIIIFPKLLPLDSAALYLPNHEGLLHTTMWVFAIFFIIFAIWCLFLKKRTGNVEKNSV